MSNFRPVNRDMDFLMPPSVDEWLPPRHLARFVVEVIEGLDLRAMTDSYRGSGEASYHPLLWPTVVVQVRNDLRITRFFGSMPHQFWNRMASHERGSAWTLRG